MFFFEKQQPELFTILFAHGLMMDLMGFSHRTEIAGIKLIQKFRTAMDENIVEYEIGETIGSHAYTHPEPVVEVGPAEIHQDHCDGSVEQKEEIVLFESAVTGFVMAFVQRPKKTMHHIFVSGPCYTFHSQISRQECENVDHYVGIHAQKYSIPAIRDLRFVQHLVASGTDRSFVVKIRVLLIFQSLNTC